MQNEWTREIERLKDERDGYRNGQQQMQDINAKLIDANNALRAELEKALGMLKPRDVTAEIIQRTQERFEQIVKEAEHE